MREPAFLRQNKDKWMEYEGMLFGPERQRLDPDRLAELYIQLIDDLGYARTFYPKSQTVKYLNGLAARTHLAIYRNKKEKRNRLLTFWSHELPLVVYASHRFMLYSLIAFSFAFVIGMFSTLSEEGYLLEVLGTEYVSMSMENIKNGDPTAVYKQTASLPMFVRIASNNIRVSFMVFAAGILASVGAILMVFQNGVMIGAFLTMFFIKGVALQAIPVVYIHGTLEISALILAGGAGMMLGNKFLFPGTYSRKESLMEGARHGLKVILGLVPVFLVAAFLESYVTRYSDMPWLLNLAIILLSAAFMIWYFVLYPIQLHKKLVHGNPQKDPTGQEA